MSIRLMSWNIERFGINKLGTRGTDPQGLRREYILSTVKEVSPDILVIIEVQTQGQHGVGSLASDTSGGPGTLALWAELPGGTTAKGGPWAVIPPLVINVPVSRKGNAAYSECMAVFFRTDKLDFTGPYKWTGPESHRLAQPLNGPGDATAYAKPWNDCLPATPPYGGFPSINQNRLAGQPIFFESESARSKGLAISFGNQPQTRVVTRHNEAGGIFMRNPWHMSFVEKSGTRAGRIIKVWAVHFPPSFPACGNATAALTCIPSVVAPLADKEVRIICGDFNVNYLDKRQVRQFDQLTAGQAIWGFGTPTDLYHLQLIGGRSVLKAVGSADVTGNAPYYGYAPDKYLDNILIAYGTDAVDPIAIDVGIVNRVVQDPGGYSCALSKTIPSILRTRKTHRTTARQRRETFQRSSNFGKIGGRTGASDHAPMVISF